MALPARQLDRSADDLVSIDQAAELTGDSVRTWQERAKREAEAATRENRRSLAYKAKTPQGGKAVWHVSRSMDPKLSRCPNRRTRDERAREPLIAKHPAHLVDRGLRRNHWLQAWRRACESRRSDGATDRDLAARVVRDAKQAEPEGFKISVRSLYLWWQRYNRLGNDGAIAGIEGLVDRYGSGEGSETRSADAVECFYELYHNQNKLSVRTCHDAVCREATRKGWRWPTSYTATTSWLREHDDLSVTCLMRDGLDVWARRYLPYLKQDYSKLEPGEMFVADHSQLDLWCTYKGKQIRPWLTAFQDLRSRCIVGWHVGPMPHQDAILYAMRGAFRDWAIPRVLRIDNGKDFAAKSITGYTKKERNRLKRALGHDWRQIVKRGEALVDCTDARWLGILGELDIDPIWALPYSPWSKGTLERWFGTLHGQHDKLYPTYCGNRPANKPEGVDALRLKHPDAVPTMDEVRERLGQYLDTYHRTVHGSLDGWTPLAVWQSAARLRRAVGDELAFLMDVRGLYKVTANGVSMRVGGATLHWGAKSQALKRLVGRKVLVALDPDDISTCWAFTPDREKRQLISRLESNESIDPYTTADDVREAIAEMKREQSAMHKARRAQTRRTLRMSERMRQHSVDVRAELLATGTDAADSQPTIVPVRTGFERVSSLPRSTFETCRLTDDDGDMADLFADDDPSDLAVDGDDEGMEDLFGDDDPKPGEASDDGIDGLLYDDSA